MASAAPPLIAIVGPTAAGKTALALRIAGVWPAEVVSCDSLQVYRGFDIGSGKATPAERERVPHHLIDVVEAAQGFSAAEFAARARVAISEIAERGRLPLVVGGTGLYFRALFRGLFEGPPRDEQFRARVEAMAARFGAPRLHRVLRRVDPESAARIAASDLVRVVRALEVLRGTGRPIGAHHRAQTPVSLGRRTLLLGLNPDREQLREAVVARTRAMLSAGLFDEVRRLAARHGTACRPLAAIGYRQALAVLEGRLSATVAEPAIVTETMRFAKRQMTWFRKEPGIEWFQTAETAFAAAREWLSAIPL